MQKIRNFIIVDDDPWTNKITLLHIKRAIAENVTQIFTKGDEALSYITNEFAANRQPTILFLDINMPTMTGWEFLDQFNMLQDELKTNITIYMLSSSIDKCDVERAKHSENVTDFISKPLTINTIQQVSGAGIKAGNE